MGMVWIDLTPEEMCNLMCGEPQEDEEEIDADEDKVTVKVKKVKIKKTERR